MIKEHIEQQRGRTKADCPILAQRASERYSPAVILEGHEGGCGDVLSLHPSDVLLLNLALCKGAFSAPCVVSVRGVRCPLILACCSSFAPSVALLGPASLPASVSQRLRGARPVRDVMANQN